MTKFFILFSLILPFNSYASEKASIEELLKKLFSHKVSKDQFKVHNCSFQESKWLTLLLGGPSFEEKLDFKKGCDLEGKFRPRMRESFELPLKLRNFNPYQDFKSTAQILMTLDFNPKLQINLKDAKLVGNKKEVVFDLIYSATVNPLNEDILEKDLGGELHIKSINGKKENKKYPLKNLIKN